MTRSPLWNEHRDVAEIIAEAIADSMTPAIGLRVELGLVQSYTPETMLSAVNFPQRAVVVRFTAPARDALIVLTSLSDEVARSAAEAAAKAALKALNVPVLDDSFTIESTIEYTNLDEAVDEWDALFLEATYDIGLQHGDMRVVLGTGLLEASTAHMNGIADPFAEGGAAVEPEPEPAVDIDAIVDAVAASPTSAAAASVDAIVAEHQAALAAAAAAETAAHAEPSILEQLDAELAAEEAMAAAEREALESMQAVERNAAAAAAAQVATAASQNSDRWASLLSGVEVELSAELGRTDLTLGSITSLDSESVLTLDQLVNDPVTVYVNGTAYATARLVVVDGEYGIEILEVMEQSVPFAASLAA